MILYHGTNADFGEIDLRKSKPNKDFGQGFYLSREYIQAMEMAKIKVEQLETREQKHRPADARTQLAQHEGHHLPVFLRH